MSYWTSKIQTKINMSRYTYNTVVSSKEFDDPLDQRLCENQLKHIHVSFIDSFKPGIYHQNKRRFG